MDTPKALPPKSLDVFCAVFDFAQGQVDITCPASDYPIACLRACERRGLIAWDTERVHGKTRRWCALTELGAHYGCESLALVQAHVPIGTSVSRKRVWVKVQFDLANEDYQEAYQIAGQLAQARLLAPTIRDLLQIHEAADKGDYSLFYQLYGIPETKETSQFATMIQTFADMQQTINTLTAKLDSIQNTRIPAPMPPVHALQPVSGSTVATGLKAIAGAQIEVKAPVFDDDEDTEDLLIVTKDLTAAARTTQNFLNSIMGLVDDSGEKPKADYSKLSPRIRARMEKE